MHVAVRPPKKGGWQHSMSFLPHFLPTSFYPKTWTSPHLDLLASEVHVHITSAEHVPNRRVGPFEVLQDSPSSLAPGTPRAQKGRPDIWVASWRAKACRCRVKTETRLRGTHGAMAEDPEVRWDVGPQSVSDIMGGLIWEKD